MESSNAAVNTAGKQRGRPFEPGKSGNPNGRPKGARNRTTALAEGLLDGEAEAITRKLIDKALDKIETAAEALHASSLVLQACAAGDLSPDEALEIMNLISSHIRLVETNEIEARLTLLETQQKGLQA